MVGEIDGCGGRVDALRINDAAARMIDAHERLHDLGRRRDLETADITIERRPQVAQRFLRRIGLIDRFRCNFLGQIAERRPRAMSLGNVSRSGSRIEGHGVPRDYYGHGGGATLTRRARPANPICSPGHPDTDHHGT